MTLAFDLPAYDLIDTDAGLWALQPEWERLWRRVPGAGPFQSPAWLLPWWRQFGTGMPRVGVARDAHGLCGILPLYVLDEKPSRKLLPIGAGITDQIDALLAPGVAVDLMLHAALSRAASDGVVVCDLIETPPGSPLRTAAPPQGWGASWTDTSACPVLSLQNHSGIVPPRMARKLRMNRNRAERAGGWSSEVATEATLGAFLDALIRLHQARWTAHGKPGTLDDPRVLAFHREAAPLLLAEGALRLQVLRLGGAIVASIYALLSGRDGILFYLSGFDEARAFESPGTILLGDMLEHAIAEGRQEADFLRGGEAYKYAWGGVDRRNATCRLMPR